MIEKKVYLGVLVVVFLCCCSTFPENLRSSGIKSYQGRKVFNRVSLRTYSGNVRTNIYSREFILSQNDWCFLTGQDKKFLMKFKANILHQILDWPQ